MRVNKKTVNNYLTAIMDLNNGLIVKSLSNDTHSHTHTHKSPINLIEISDDYLVLSADSNEAVLYDLISGEDIIRMHHNDIIKSISITKKARGGSFITGSWDCTAQVQEVCTSME